MAYDFSKLKKQVAETDEWLVREYTSIRTGRATPTLLSTIRAEAYGSRMPLEQLASVSVEDARTIRIIPWDKEVSKAIEKAITEADLGVGAIADDTGLRVVFPELTAERRTMLTKLAAEKLEHARITLRGHRGETIKELDAAEKEGGMGEDDLRRLKEETQKIIDAGMTALERHLTRKEEEIAS